MLGKFAQAHLHDLSEDQLDRFEALLANDDADIYGWLSGRFPVPEAHDNDVMALLKNSISNRAGS